MQSLGRVFSLAFMFAMVSPAAAPGQDENLVKNAERRALEYLTDHTPRWRKENECFSCHNNGDAARALFLAKSKRRDIPVAALATTMEWLSKPNLWDHNGGDGDFSDKDLANLQFTLTLGAGLKAGDITEPSALALAAERVAMVQSSEGPWKMGAEDTIGSPVTYGWLLATVLARNALADANSAKYREPILSANQWLRQQKPRNVFDAASLLLAARSDTRFPPQVKSDCLTILRESQSRDGGWGPTRRSPPEPFDTAIVLLAVHDEASDAAWRQRMAAGRVYLARTQLDDGSWDETTRPAGAVSYAQRVSTTAWAAIALLDAAQSKNPGP